MKTKLLASLGVIAVTAIYQGAFAAEPPRMKMTTEIPVEIVIPLERVGSGEQPLNFGCEINECMLKVEV